MLSQKSLLRRHDQLLLFHVDGAVFDQVTRRSVECRIQNRIRLEWPWCYQRAARIIKYPEGHCRLSDEQLRTMADEILRYLEGCFPEEVKGTDQHHYDWLDSQVSHVIRDKWGRVIARGVQQESRFTLLIGSRVAHGAGSITKVRKILPAAAVQEIESLWADGCLAPKGRTRYQAYGLGVYVPVDMASPEEAALLVSGRQDLGLRWMPFERSLINGRLPEEELVS